MRGRVPRGGWRIVAPLAAVALLTVIAFGSGLGGGFVYDDDWTIVHNEHLDEPLGVVLGACWRGDAKERHIPDATRPAQVASMWLDRRLFGSNPFGYHADSLLLAAVTSVVATLAAFALTRRRRVAVLAGAIFAVAPLHAEVVAAVNNREDLLAGLGVLGAIALIFWPWPSAAPALGRRRTAVVAALAAALWSVGLAAKEAAIVLVPLVACAWWLQSSARRRGWWTAREPVLLSLSAVGIVWLDWRIGLHYGADDVPLAKAMGAADRLLRFARYETWAVAESLLPVRAAPEYARSGPASAAWLLVAAGLFVAAWRMARNRRTRVPALGLAIALIAPLASSPLVGPVNEHADRYLCVAVLGGAIAWAWGIDWLARRRGRRVAGIAAALVVCGLAAQSARAAAAWHDERSFWTEATRVAPESARAWAGLSRVLRREGDVDGALALSDRAIRVDPTFAPAHVTHAYDLLRAGRRDEALAELHTLQESSPSTPGIVRGLECAAGETDAVAACLDPP